MALIIPAITANLIGAFAGGLVLGISMPQLALATSSAFFSYNVSGVTVSTIDAGITLGPGVGLGFGILLPPPVIIKTLFSSFSSFGIRGIMAPSMVIAIATTFSISYAVANIVTTHPSVGEGSGIVSLIPNSGTSIGIFISMFESFGLNGPSAVKLASAIAVGLDQSLSSAKGFVVINGGVVPSPTSGGGSGKIF